MIQFGDSKDDEIKDVNLFSLEIGRVTLSIYRIAIFPKFEIYNGKHCFLIQSPRLHFAVSKGVK